MKISDEVANYLEGYMDDSLLERFGAKEIAENLVRIFLKDIWKPISEAPKGKELLGRWSYTYHCDDGPTEGMDFIEVLPDGAILDSEGLRAQGLYTHYCDPADIIPESNQATKKETRADAPKLLEENKRLRGSLRKAVLWTDKEELNLWREFKSIVMEEEEKNGRMFRPVRMRIDSCRVMKTLRLNEILKELKFTALTKEEEEAQAVIQAYLNPADILPEPPKENE